MVRLPSPACTGGSMPKVTVRFTHLHSLIWDEGSTDQQAHNRQGLDHSLCGLSECSELRRAMRQRPERPFFQSIWCRKLGNCSTWPFQSSFFNRNTPVELGRAPRGVPAAACNLCPLNRARIPAGLYSHVAEKQKWTIQAAFIRGWTHAAKGRRSCNTKGRGSATGPPDMADQQGSRSVLPQSAPKSTAGHRPQAIAPVVYNRVWSRYYRRRLPRQSWCWRDKPTPANAGRNGLKAHASGAAKHFTPHLATDDSWVWVAGPYHALDLTCPAQ